MAVLTNMHSKALKIQFGKYLVFWCRKTSVTGQICTEKNNTIYITAEQLWDTRRSLTIEQECKKEDEQTIRARVAL